MHHLTLKHYLIKGSHFVGEHVDVTCPTSFLKTQSVPATMVKEVVTIWKSSGRVTIRSVALRGGRVMTSRSTGSTPKLPEE